ncbi:alkyl/aryl-sulfatase [Peredibacter sp. HCB2-198]|uniref:alkyl/aryl-sulfatase n=1 Tax=Peredibacter sp. HCB2-198 TaxID=3383025 RepID=UPI0038B68873
MKLKQIQVASLAMLLASPYVPAATAKKEKSSKKATSSIEAGKATAKTKEKNAAVLKELNFDDNESFDFATRGLVAKLPDPKIMDQSGKVVNDGDIFIFTQNKSAPSTVNPSLWRQAQLVSQHGLFKVADKIYQFRGYDIANMTLIQGNTGWIVIDTTTAPEVAAAGLKLANEKLGKRPVSAVIITHSHGDHFGGMSGVLTDEEVKGGKIPIIAPQGFMEEAISENLYAGNAMARRAAYSYGDGLENGPEGSVGTGLGTKVSTGSTGIIPPNKLIASSGEKMTIDGIDIEFQMAPGTEAPAEMLMFFPQLKALHLAEDATYNMHNLYTLRGAKVRSPLVWANALNTTLEMFGDRAEVAMASHHWPTFGKSKIRDFVTKQRDMYKFINDQTLRLANQGYDMEEIAEQIKLPDTLAKEFYNRGYYGSLSHNVKATYQYYLGYFNGNPSTLNQHPRTVAAKKYVEAMGGADKVIKQARKAYDKGDYRWSAEILNHVVYANAENKKAKDLLAASYEQMGFQAESATWRGFYLMGANELRNGAKVGARTLVDASKLPAAMVVDFASTLVDPDKASGKTKRIGVELTDTKERYTLTLGNSVLFLGKPQNEERLDSTYTLTSGDFGRLLSGTARSSDLVENGSLKVSGDEGAIDEIASILTRPDPMFPLVTPVKEKSTQFPSTMQAQEEK